jgi:hypothetical protein
MSFTNDPFCTQVLVPPGAATAGDPDNLYCLNRLGGKAQVVNVDFVANGAITANDSNNATITVSVGGTSLGSIQTTTGGTGDITDGSNTAITLSDTAANLVAEGGLVKVAITKTGSGVAVKGQVAVTLQRVRVD